ncbi:MAG: gas vesicle protein K [Chloroflexota bacterium]|nr:gas vesicle protein K [Chloroflexota bacterium]MDE3101001.1 gas vesicle protein K [Chloroflexota bacterium]
MTKGTDVTLLDVVDRLIDTGVNLTGEATISVADVDLIYLGLDLAVGSVEKMRAKKHGPGAMSAEMHRGVPVGLPQRVNVDPSDVERSLAKLVLTIVELIRQLLERQAIRRMDSGSLTDAEVDRIGTALMRLEEKVVEMAGIFRLEKDDLQLGLGPLGDLL